LRRSQETVRVVISMKVEMKQQQRKKKKNKQQQMKAATQATNKPQKPKYLYRTE
jgi:hypothetical protein